MSTSPAILALSGSTRTGSYNTALLRIGAQLLTQAGAKVRILDLTDFDLPIYNGDVERDAGLPDRALELKRIFKEADGFFIASPEHNMSVSALLKNTIDWVSRSVANESGKLPFEGKVAALCAASTGGLGGHRGLMHLRLVLSGLGMHVLPTVVSVGSAGQAFDAEGRMNDESQLRALRALAEAVVQTTRLLRIQKRGDTE